MNAPMLFRQVRRGLALCAFAWVATLDLAAMPADPKPFVFTQPDGTRVTIKMRGDEFFHWHEDAAGFTVVRSGDRFVYADLDAAGQLVATAWTAGVVDPASRGLTAGTLPLPPRRAQNLNGAAKPYRPWVKTSKPGAVTNIAAAGTVKNLVILCMFNDHNITPAAGDPVEGRAQADYDVLFNQVAGDPVLAPTGSVRDAYRTLSLNRVTMQSTVTAWVTLPQSQAYYGSMNNGLPFGANGAPYPTNAQGMVEDALDAADALVDFAQFDTDSDGYIDAITIIHSGYGGEQGGAPADSIWSHKASLPTAWESAETNANGQKVKVFDYHTEPALFGTSGTAITRIGVVCHELGHFFGLPDLYDTDSSSQGIGDWCMMADSWGASGDQLNPPHFSAWCRDILGWVTPTVLASPGVYTIFPAETHEETYKITQGFPAGEYLLIENRQRLNYDVNIPRGGLAVWHVDTNVGGNTTEGFPGQPGWPENGTHYKIALLQADGRYDLEKNANQSDAGDLFSEFTASEIGMNTVPDTNSYKNGIVQATTNRLSEIRFDTGNVMRFRFDYYADPLFVDKFFTGTSTGSRNNPFKTVTDAYNLALNGDVIVVRGGEYVESPPPMTKRVRIENWRGIMTLHR